MRLRYLHLPAFGPLRDAAVVFHRNELLRRPGTLNFIVGVNGTGKSSLLRSIYLALRGLDDALESTAPLPFAFALAYDASHRDPERTVLFWHPGGATARARMVLFDGVLPEEVEWRAYLTDLEADKTPARAQVVSGDRFSGNGDLREHLPCQVLAYTSGDLDPWEQAVERFVDPEILESPGKGEAGERPRRWTASRELAAPEVRETDGKEFVRRGRVQANLPTALPRQLLLRPEETRLAALTLALWHSATEFRPLETDADVAELRRTLQEGRSAPAKGDGCCKPSIGSAPRT